MNDLLYKMLEPTKTIEESLDKIKEAFVTFYGEEDREYIEQKFKNLIIVGYGHPDHLSATVFKIKQNRSNELIEKFFDKIGIFDKREEMKKILFSNNCLDYLNLIPIQRYINYLECDKLSWSYSYMKNEALNFLKTINPNVTLENMDDLKEQGVFDDISEIIPIYKEMIEVYLNETKKLDSYEKEAENNTKLKNKFHDEYWIRLLEEFSYLFSKDDILKIKESFEKYGYFFPSKQIEAYLGSTLLSTSLIDSFSEENEKIIEQDDGWKKESVIDDRIRFFKNMGIDLGDDYELYKNNKECKKLIPTQYLIDKISSRKKELADISLNQYYKSTKEYQTNRKRIDEHGLLNKDDSYDANAYFNNKIFVSPNIVLNNGTYSLLPLMCININALEYLDVVTIHEFNHVFELNLNSINGNTCEFTCGWDILSGIVSKQAEEVIDLDDRKDKRKYELFNEIINELIAQQITAIMHGSGNYIFTNKENTKDSGGTSYEHTFFLVKDFFETYKKDILNTRKTRNMQPLFDKIGKENFDDLNNLFHVFYDNFGGMAIYSVYEDLKNNKETEKTKIYKQLCEERDNILKRMQEHNLINDKGNQK